VAILDELLVRVGLQDDTAEGGARVNRGLAGVAAGAGIAGVAVGAAFSFGLEGAMDIAAAQSSLKTQLDLTEVEAQRAGDVAGDVFSRGFGGSMEDVTDALGGVHSSIGDLGDFTDAELEQMSVSALALAKTFDVDVADATGAVGQMIKTGLVADATEGFDLIAKTMQSVPAALRDDLLPTVDEYSTQFRNLGLTGADAMGLMVQGVEAGARDIDVVADTLKEFSIEAVAGSDKIGDAWDALGLDSDKLFKQMSEGGDSAKEALDQTLQALATMEPGVERNALAVELFGTKAEDMGDALFALDPAAAAAATGLDDTGGSMQDLINAMEGDPAQQFDAVMRTVQNTLGQMLLPVLIRVGEFFRENKDLIKAAVIPAMVALVAVFVVLTAATIAWTIALLANPMVWIIGLIVLTIAAVVLLVAKWDWVKAKLLAHWEAIKDALGRGWDWLVANVFAPIGRFFTQTIPRWAGMVRDALVGAWSSARDRVSALVSGLLTWVQGRWNAFIGFFRGLPGRIASAASGMWDGIKSGFRSAVNFLIAGWNRLSFTIGGGSIAGVSIPSLTLSTPNIPFLAEGGIVTSPTLAMIGEGREDEAVMPLSKLEQLINTTAAPSTGKVQPQRMAVRFESGGGDAFTDWLMGQIRVEFGGDAGALGQEG
jgi:CII-binding regulator of phage lambda lysogenization HflD